MLKRTIKYTDLDDNPREETWYFNLTRAEVIAMEISYEGGLKATIEKASAAQDGNAVMSIFKDVIRTAVGKRSDDGTRFIKTKEIADDFESSLAYDELFMSLVTNAEAAAEFMTAILPKQGPPDIKKK